MTRARRRAFAAAAVALAVALACAIGEVVCRARGGHPLVWPTIPYALWVEDARLGFRTAPSARFVDPVTGAKVETGPRGERRSAGPGVGPAVLFVGDSTTFCGQVDDDRTGASEVSKLIRARVVNAGVPGYSTVQSLRMAEEWLEASRDVRVVVYTACDNDWYENLLESTYPPARAPWARVASGAVEVVEPPDRVLASVVFTIPRTPMRELAYPIRSRSALAEAAVELVARRRAAATTGRPADVESRIGWAFDSGGELVLTKLVGDLRDLCARRGAVLVVTRFTVSRDGKCGTEGCDRVHARLHPAEKLARICDELKIPFVDASPAFGDDDRPYRAIDAWGGLDNHWNALGTATWAGAVAPRIARALADQK